MTRLGAWCAVLLGASVAVAQSPTPAEAPADPALDAILAEWDAHAATLADLRVPFTQERRLALRPTRAITASGTFLMRRDPESGQRAIRWHFTAPRERIEVLRGSEVRTYEPYLPRERQVVEVRDLREFGLDPSKLDVLGQSAAQLRAAYAITPLPAPSTPSTPSAPRRDGDGASDTNADAADATRAPRVAHLRLEPRDATIAKRVAAIELTLDRASGLPRTVVLLGPVQRARSGVERRSVTTYHFDVAQAQRNTGLDAALFELAPDGVPIERR